MSGLSATSLTPLEPDAHLAQSIGDILGTRRGTRVLRRDYESDLHRLIDRPMNGEVLVDVAMEVAEALDRWEPRLRLTRVQVPDASAGRLTVQLDGETDHGALTLSTTIGEAP